MYDMVSQKYDLAFLAHIIINLRIMELSPVVSICRDLIRLQASCNYDGNNQMDRFSSSLLACVRKESRSSDAPGDPKVYTPLSYNC